MGWIKNRIEAEYRKHHKHLDWSRLAEAKIKVTIKGMVNEFKDKVLNVNTKSKNYIEILDFEYQVKELINLLG